MSNENQEPVWNLYGFDQPQQILATVIDGEEIYFDCGECGAVDAVMYGYMATSPRRADVARNQQTNRPAYFCQKCWEKYLNAGKDD